MIESFEYERRRQQVLSEIDDNSLVILFAGVAPHCSADESYNFEVNRNFYYLTGIDQENSALMLVKAEGETHVYLFIDEKNEKVEKWTGIKLTSEEAKKISGISNVLLRSALDGKISASLNKDMTHFGLIKNIYLDLEKELKIAGCKSTFEFKKEMEIAYPDLEIKDIHDIVMNLRMIKSPAEIEMIKDAIHTTDIALRNVLLTISKAGFEFNLRNVFEFNVKEDLNASLAFPSIVAGGKNAVILHYPSANDALNHDDLVLLDVGARKSYYCADISRTYPMSGKYNELQKKIYEIVLACNKETAKFMHRGISLKDVNQFAKDFLAEECFEKGLIESKDKISDVYYHSVSHHLGLDTHDGTDRESLLEPGMVITCEPGLYFKEFGIGVRIEDDVLITEEGSEVLSESIIKEVSDIEKFLSIKQ